MTLKFSVATRDRRFSKTMHRIRNRLTRLCDAFQSTELKHPIHEAILVIITDDEEPGFVEEVQNNDGFFQVIAGISQRGSDDELTKEVFAILQRAARLFPFATPDHETLEELFAQLRPSIVSS